MITGGRGAQIGYWTQRILTCDMHLNGLASAIFASVRLLPAIYNATETLIQKCRVWTCPHPPLVVVDIPLGLILGL